LINDLTLIDSSQRQEIVYRLFVQIWADENYKDRELFIYSNIIDSSQKFISIVSQAIALLEQMNESQDIKYIYQDLREMGLLFMWGNSKAAILKSLEAVKAVISEDSIEQQVSGALKYIQEHFPLTWKMVHYSPHSCFNQNGILGAPDTGGQVIYIVDLIRETVADLKTRNKNSGILDEDNHPQIIVLTRLIKQRLVKDINEQDWA